MTSPPTPADVTCPACGHAYAAYVRVSINLSLGETWSKRRLEEATTAVCPECSDGASARSSSSSTRP